MKTTVVESDKAKNTNNDVKNNIRPSLTGKEAKDESSNSNADQNSAQSSQPETTGGAAVKASDSAAVGNPNGDPKPNAEAVKLEVPAAPGKKEIKEFLKPAFNLDSTVKLVGELSKKITQRDKLKATIDNLDTFTIAANENGDVTESNKFYRCELVIHDDEGNEFVTKNAYIIDQVAQFVNSLCVEKLAEIEAEIVIPA